MKIILTSHCIWQQRLHLFVCSKTFLPSIFIVFGCQRINYIKKPIMYMLWFIKVNSMKFLYFLRHVNYIYCCFPYTFIHVITTKIYKIFQLALYVLWKKYFFYFIFFVVFNFDVRRWWLCSSKHIALIVWFQKWNVKN